MNLTELKQKLGAFERTQEMYTKFNNPARNQYINHFEHGVMFQSYDSVIVIILFETENTFNSTRKRVYIGDNWDYSATTSFYLKQFLDESKEQTREKINSGIYTLITE